MLRIFPHKKFFWRPKSGDSRSGQGSPDRRANRDHGLSTRIAGASSPQRKACARAAAPSASMGWRSDLTSRGGRPALQDPGEFSARPHGSRASSAHARTARSGSRARPRCSRAHGRAPCGHAFGRSVACRRTRLARVVLDAGRAPHGRPLSRERRVRRGVLRRRRRRRGARVHPDLRAHGGLPARLGVFGSDPSKRPRLQSRRTHPVRDWRTRMRREPALAPRAESARRASERRHR
jgi:hypothetical protein